MAPLCWWCARHCRALTDAATRLLSCSTGAGRTTSSRGAVCRVGLLLSGAIEGLSWHLPRPPIHPRTRIGTGAAAAWLVEGPGVMAMGCPASRVSASRRLGTPLGTGHTIFFTTRHVHSHLVTCAPMLALTRQSEPPNFYLARLVRVPLHGRVECKAASLSPPRQSVGFIAFPRS
jgi:hypothetical protein